MTRATDLRETIHGHLKSGAWPPGHRIPTERELSEQYGVSRTTVRRVLADFKDQKLIRPTVGSGGRPSPAANTCRSAGTADWVSTAIAWPERTTASSPDMLPLA